MQEKLAAMEIDTNSAAIHRIPHESKTLELEKALKILNIIERFEENDDVQEVFHNLNITEEIIAELNG